MKNLCGLSILQLRNCKNLKLSGVSIWEKLGVSTWERLFPLSMAIAEFQWRDLSLYLNDCSILNVPNAIGFLFSLEALDLSGNLFSEIPQNILQLEKLKYLGLRDCLQLRLIPALPPRLTKLDAENCISLRSVTSKSTGVEGNIFEFLFTNCYQLNNLAKKRIMAYALKKFIVIPKGCPIRSISVSLIYFFFFFTDQIPC